MMNVILLGPPGAGKGTQASKLIQNGFVHIAAGDLLREAISQHTDLGLQAKGFIDKGELVPDNLVTQLIFDKVESSKEQPILFDGFPRNASQCQALDTLLKENNLCISHVISLVVPEDELIKRMLSRGRKDDTEDIIKNRFNVFKQETEPIIQFYQAQNLVHTVDGLGSVDEIFNRIAEILDLKPI